MARKKKQDRRLFFILILIGLVIVLPITWMIMKAMGEKSGVEFSPDDFTFRQFNYCRLPLIGWTQRGIKYTAVSNAQAQSLIADDWIRVSGRNPKRWHLVSESGSDFSTTAKLPAECDARFLTDYFDITNADGENEVMKWTDEQPESAKIFWPLIAELARDYIYLPIPDLMEFVLRYPDPDKDTKFEAQLLQRVSDVWYQAGMTDQLKGLHERAIERFDNAIRIGDGHSLAEKARQTSVAAQQ